MLLKAYEEYDDYGGTVTNPGGGSGVINFPSGDVDVADWGDQTPISYVSSPGKETAIYVPNAPEKLSVAELTASGLNIAKLVVDAAGKYYQYKPAVGGGYVRIAANPSPGLFGLSPMMLAAIGLVGFVALKGK